jgi:hypothetical protein
MNAYVVVGTCGEYEDKEGWIANVFLEEGEALQRQKQLLDLVGALQAERARYEASCERPKSPTPRDYGALDYESMVEAMMVDRVLDFMRRRAEYQAKRKELYLKECEIRDALAQRLFKADPRAPEKIQWNLMPHDNFTYTVTEVPIG